MISKDGLVPAAGEVRAVRSSRIKRLVSFRTEGLPLDPRVREGELRAAICREIGREFAAKLMQFEKVFIGRDDDGVTVTWRAELEVIVPEGMPR